MSVGQTLKEKVFARWRAKVQPGQSDQDCWQWIGAKDRNGRGKQRVQGQVYYATQLTWWLHDYGPLNDHRLFHTCGNPNCVNPAHLETRETIWTKKDLTPEEKEKRFELAMKKVRNYRKHHHRGC